MTCVRADLQVVMDRMVRVAVPSRRVNAFRWLEGWMRLVCAEDYSVALWWLCCGLYLAGEFRGRRGDPSRLARTAACGNDEFEAGKDGRNACVARTRPCLMLFSRCACWTRGSRLFRIRRSHCVRCVLTQLLSPAATAAWEFILDNSNAQTSLG